MLQNDSVFFFLLRVNCFVFVFCCVDTYFDLFHQSKLHTETLLYCILFLDIQLLIIVLLTIRSIPRFVKIYLAWIKPYKSITCWSKLASVFGSIEWSAISNITFKHDLKCGISLRNPYKLKLSSVDSKWNEIKKQIDKW